MNDILTDIGSFVAALGVIGGGILWLYRKAIKPAVKNLNEWQDMIARIEAELKPNGGASIRDSLNRLEQSVAKLRGISKVILLDNDEGIFETDAKGHCVYVNRTYERMVGRSFSELKGDGWMKIIHPADLPRVSLEWETCIRQEREFEMTFRYVHQNGKEFPVKVTANPIRDPSPAEGAVLGYLGRSAIIKE